MNVCRKILEKLNIAHTLYNNNTISKIARSRLKNIKAHKVFLTSVNIVYLVLEKTLKGTRGVRLDNRKVLCAQSPRTEYFSKINLTFKLKFCIFT